MGNVQPTTGRAMDAASSLRLLWLLALRLALWLRVLLLALLLHEGQCEAAGAGVCTSGAGSRQGCDVSRSEGWRRRDVLCPLCYVRVARVYWVVSIICK